MKVEAPAVLVLTPPGACSFVPTTKAAFSELAAAPPIVDDHRLSDCLAQELSGKNYSVVD